MSLITQDTATTRPATPFAAAASAVLAKEAKRLNRAPKASVSAEVPLDPIANCAKLDQSDTSNAQRLIAHFGENLKVLRISDCPSPPYVVWAGTHWDFERGPMMANATAQQVGDKIMLEVPHLQLTEKEQATVDAAQSISDDDKGDNAKLMRNAAARAQAREDSMRAARAKFAVSSKNRARIQAMLDLAAPHIDVAADDFNADPLRVATLSHTLQFSREVNATGYAVSAVSPRAGHDRADMITRLVPVHYDPNADCPKWREWLCKFQPNPAVRLALQTFSGLGLLGITVQRMAFHFGQGANGKSIFLQTLMRVLGPLGVDLPAESISGDNQRNAGGASPDLARLYGARFVRVAELPKDKGLDEEMVKRLTGGETIDVRNLFRGYFSFKPFFTVHTSGNGYPRIDGTDHGIWRRMMVVPWTVTVPEAEQREFEDMLSDFSPEYSGILNWLIDGALYFLERGLVLPDEVQAATREYRDEMDPVSGFVASCVRESNGSSVPARQMYEAYVSYSMANAMKPVIERRFAQAMKGKVARVDERIRKYINCELYDVPNRPDVDSERGASNRSWLDHA